MVREKIKLLMGTPLVVLLEDTHGEERSSKFSDGVEYRFNVTYGAVACHLYLPVDGKLALSRSGALAGDEVEICKRMKNQSLEFTARVIGDARTLGRSGPGPAQSPAGWTPGPARIEAPPPAREARQAALADSGPAPFAPMPAYAHGAAAPQSGFTSGAAARQFAPAPLTAPASVPSPATVLMAQCLMAAVDIAVGVESYAKAKGKALTFNEEDVRAMGISLHINLSKERY